MRVDLVVLPQRKMTPKLEQLWLEALIDAAAYGLTARCALYRTDHKGRHRAGVFDPIKPVVSIELPPRALCVLEFHPGAGK